MNDALREIEELLRRYGHRERADLAMTAREMLARDPSRAYALVDDSAWWADRDSIAALDLGVEGGFSAESRRDARRLWAALIAVQDAMAEAGRHHPQAELIAAQFRKWLASRI